MMEIQKIVDFMNNENKALREMLKVANAEKEAFSQTIKEIVLANISLKAGAALLEGKFQEQEALLKDKINQIENLQKQISELSKPLEESPVVQDTAA